MSGVAIIGWGSLIHHPEGDATRGQKPLATKGEWQQTGPVLPVEFSRISEGRHLTLVIDPEEGRDNTTFVIASQFDIPREAARNLREREGCPESKIGRMLRSDPVPLGCGGTAIHTWLKGTDFDAVVWTALGPKFLPGQTYSAQAGDAYLETLHNEERRRAYRYIAEAPDEITTPLREIARWPEAVAVHEAGHFVIACALNLEVLRLSRIPVDDRPGNPPTIGCHLASLNHPQLELMAGDMGGAWAQVLHCPESIAERKVRILARDILLPSTQHALYSWLGWKEDLKPVFQILQMNPALAKGCGLPDAAQIQRLNQRLRTFFLRGDIGQAINLVSDALITTPIIRGPELASLRASVDTLINPSLARQNILDGI